MSYSFKSETFDQTTQFSTSGRQTFCPSNKCGLSYDLRFAKPLSAGLSAKFKERYSWCRQRIVPLVAHVFDLVALTFSCVFCGSTAGISIFLPLRVTRTETLLSSGCVSFCPFLSPSSSFFVTSFFLLLVCLPISSGSSLVSFSGVA